MPTMALIVSEKRIWRELVQAHFTSLQIEFMLNRWEFMLNRWEVMLNR